MNERNTAKLFGIAIAICLIISYIGFAQERVWILLTTSKDECIDYFILQDSIRDATFIMKIADRDELVGGIPAISRWECDCFQNKIRLLSYGSSYENMKPIKSDWIIPNPNSIAKIMWNNICKK